MFVFGLFFFLFKKNYYFSVTVISPFFAIAHIYPAPPLIVNLPHYYFLKKQSITVGNLHVSLCNNVIMNAVTCIRNFNMCFTATLLF